MLINEVVTTHVKKGFHPTQLANLLLLCSIDESNLTFNSADISGWSDLSTNRKDLNQDTAVNQPLYGQPGVLVENNYGALDFDGSAHYTDAVNTGGNCNVLVLVTKPDSAVSAATTAFQFVNMNGSFYGLAGGDSTAGLTNEILTLADSGGGRSGWVHASDTLSADLHIIVCIWDGSKYRIRIDGEEKTISTLGTPILLAASALELGRRGNGDWFYNGKVQDILVLGATPPDSTIFQIEQYYSEKRGVKLL